MARTATQTSCPSCGASVSAQAYDCPGCGHPLRKPRRGPFGWLAKWLFIGFNVFMLIWLVSGLSATGDLIQGTTDEIERAGAAIGATIGLSFVVGLWVAGDVILGLLVLLTRPRK